VDEVGELSGPVEYEDAPVWPVRPAEAIITAIAIDEHAQRDLQSSERAANTEEHEQASGHPFALLEPMLGLHVDVPSASAD
jgi:hypothetical protein